MSILCMRKLLPRTLNLNAIRNTSKDAQSLKVFEVFVNSPENDHQWKITVEATGHTQAYKKAMSLHNVTVLSTRQLTNEGVKH